MVDIQEIDLDTPPSPSEERRSDAEEIEVLMSSAKRPTVKMHLEALAKKLRKESEALKRVEACRAKTEADATSMEVSTDETVGESPTTTDQTEPPQQHQPQAKPVAVARAAATGPITVSPATKYISVDRFAFDAGSYNTPQVTVYVSLPGVGSISRDLISCDFTSTSFDLIVKDLEGKSYRLFKDDLEKDIDKDKSKFIVKADKIIIKLGKIKGEYGSYDYWSKLSDPKKHKKGTDGKRMKEDPSASIMELMKEMYDSGDDKMKKMIGETMMKQQRGELDREMGKAGGLGGLGDLGDMDDV